MANKRDIQPEGQLVLLSPTEAGYEMDIERRCSVSRLLTPEFLNMTQNDYIDITPAVMDNADPRKLRPSLIGVPHDSSNAVSFLRDSTRTKIDLAVTPEEYTILARNVAALGRASTMTTLRKRPDDRDFTPHTAAADRSAHHTFETKFSRMGQYVKNVLLPRKETLAKFEESSRPKHAGLARFSNEGEMREKFEEIRTFAIGDMLKAIRLQRDWTPEQEDLAFRATLKRIVFDRHNNQHIDNFRDLLALLDEHNNLKLELFTARGWELKRRLDTHG